MIKRFRKYFRNEDGAVTVDWVVLCAGIVAMALAIYSAMERGGLQLAADVEVYMGNQDPN